MTKNYTTVEFNIEPLESRIAPRMHGTLISQGGGAKGWGTYQQDYDNNVKLGQAADLSPSPDGA